MADDAPDDSGHDGGVSRPRFDDSVAGGAGFSYVVWFVAIVLIYMLSIGPVARGLQNMPNISRTLKYVYAPIILLHDKTPLRRPLEVYLKLWGVK